MADTTTLRDRFEAAMRVIHPEWSFTFDPVFDYHNERTRCAWEGYQAVHKEASILVDALERIASWPAKDGSLIDGPRAVASEALRQYKAGTEKEPSWREQITSTISEKDVREMVQACTCKFCEQPAPGCALGVALECIYFGSKKPSTAAHGVVPSSNDQQEADRG